MTFFHLGAEYQEPQPAFTIDCPFGHQTRRGWPARLLGKINTASARCYVFAVTDRQGFDHVNRVFENGMEQNAGFQKPNDIVNAPAPGGKGYRAVFDLARSGFFWPLNDTPGGFTPMDAQ